MRDFFKGWRRKIELLTLLMACLLMAGWVRSLIVSDTRIFTKTPTFLSQISSNKGSVIWEKYDSVSASRMIVENSRVLIFSTPSQSENRRIDVFPLKDDYKWQYGWNGFFYGQMELGSAKNCRVTIFRIPYSFIVIPLTLLSAWLLLSKPRAGKVA